MANILVVDDHPLSRQSLATLLSYHGHQINEATDGVEGLEAARKQRPDLIIADPAVRRMGGSELVRALRADRDLARIPIVFCTAGHREDASRTLAGATGVEHVITKPSNPGFILDTVHGILGLPVSGSPHEWSESSAGYVERLQLAVVRMSALIELSLDLSAERDSDRLLRTACRAARTMFHSDYAAIAMIDDRERVKSWVDGPVDQTRFETVVVREIASKQASLRAEGPSDPLVRVVSDAMPRLHALLSVPMQSPGRRYYGSILMGRAREGAAYSSDDERLAVAMASEIHAAHENVTQFFAHLDSSRERLRAMSARVLSIQEEERTRIARELHDDLAQLLTAIKLDVARLVQDLANGVVPPPRITAGIIPLIDTTLDAVGRIVSELRPSRIGEMGLAAAIEKTLSDFRQRTDIECELSIRPEVLHIPHDVAAAVFRIVDEALTNIARHSGATRAEVTVREQQEELLLEVRDNGRGIREEEKLAGNAYGIMGMNERAFLYGGSLTITGVEDRGTIVAARIPLGRNADLQERS